MEPWQKTGLRGMAGHPSSDLTLLSSLLLSPPSAGSSSCVVLRRPPSPRIRSLFLSGFFFFSSPSSDGGGMLLPVMAPLHHFSRFPKERVKEKEGERQDLEEGGRERMGGRRRGARAKQKEEMAPLPGLMNEGQRAITMERAALLFAQAIN